MRNCERKSISSLRTIIIRTMRIRRFTARIRRFTAGIRRFTAGIRHNHDHYTICDDYIAGIITVFIDVSNIRLDILESGTLGCLMT